MEFEVLWIVASEPALVLSLMILVSASRPGFIIVARALFAWSSDNFCSFLSEIFRIRAFQPLFTSYRWRSYWCCRSSMLGVPLKSIFIIILMISRLLILLTLCLHFLQNCSSNLVILVWWGMGVPLVVVSSGQIHINTTIIRLAIVKSIWIKGSIYH